MLDVVGPAGSTRLAMLSVVYIVPIESAVLGLEKALAPVFAGKPRDVTEENLQSRARGAQLARRPVQLATEMIVAVDNQHACAALRGAS